MSGVRDNMDREHLEQTMRSRGYEMIRMRIQQMAEAKLRDLRVGKGVDTDNRGRGFLDALDGVLALPNILLEEFKTKRQ